MLVVEGVFKPTVAQDVEQVQEVIDFLLGALRMEWADSGLIRDY